MKLTNKIGGNGKRFMAGEIVKKLQENGCEETLRELKSFVNKTEKVRGKLHEAFEPSFDWKECLDDRFIKQKLNYIHENPCRGKWSLVEQPWSYGHSSAKQYVTGEVGLYPVTPYVELKDVDLTKHYLQ